VTVHIVFDPDGPLTGSTDSNQPGESLPYGPATDIGKATPNHLGRGWTGVPTVAPMTGELLARRVVAVTPANRSRCKP